MLYQARAIVWAQWKTLRNYLPQTGRTGVALTVLLGAGWYGFFTAIAVAAALLIADPGERVPIAKILPGGLLIAFLYWQLMPVLMVSMGSSLDLKKLLAYPIPPGQLFGLEVALRLTTGLEVLIVLAGVAAGLLLNPKAPWWGPLALAPFALFNLFVAAGVRDLIGRLLARKGIRELLVIGFVMLSAAPRFFVAAGAPAPVRRLLLREPLGFLPWTAAARLAQGDRQWGACAALLAWTAAAYLFGRWQFERGLRFDAAAVNAPSGAAASASRLEPFFRLPAALFRDPTGALVEKELRVLVRSPRFRLVFLMALSFSLLFWLPVVFGRGGNSPSLLGGNYLTVLCLYSLLLMSDLLFWNAFGFDRAAAQLYFLAPVRISTVLKAKNTAALLFIGVEFAAIFAACAILRFPITAVKAGEALGVIAVAALLLLSAGNLNSVHNPGPVDPSNSFRAGGSGRTQALRLIAFPFALAPGVLAYAAQYAFATEWAFFGVIAFSLALAAAVYRFSMQAAVEAAEAHKETIISKLSRGEGPIGN